MQYGLGHLSVVPIRESSDPCSSMISQVLYGDHFKIKEERKKYSRVELVSDGVEGWVRNDQIHKIPEGDFKSIPKAESGTYSSEFVTYVDTGKQQLTPIVLGSRLDICSFLNHRFPEETPKKALKQPQDLVTTAMQYVNSPYLGGGKTPFGLDSSGFTQMVYKIHGRRLLRTTQGQATQGEVLSFIEESEPGDLAFFDNKEGTIDHVGIVLAENHIIHVSGYVRIDRLDHTGIFNTQTGRYSHSLRVIKKIP